MSLNRLFLFLPWLSFLSQQAPTIHDQSWLRLGIGNTSCTKLEQTFHVRIAKTEPARHKGLSHRKEPLKLDEGMLFVFDKPQHVNFWMKDTWIPLELLLFDEKAILRDVLEMKVEADPKNPINLYSGDYNVSAALEVSPNILKSQSTEARTLCVWAGS